LLFLTKLTIIFRLDWTKQKLV